MKTERKKALPRAVFNWSGGKDSALALYKTLQAGEYDVVALLTTVNRVSRRSSMHGIPHSLLQLQADSIGLPLYVVDLRPQGDMADYENAMEKAVNCFKEQGVKHFIFGDIFLEEVRRYREKQLAPYGIEVVEPIWGRSSAEIVEEFLSSGLQTVVVTTTAGKLDEAFVGRRIDRAFLCDLPEGVDVCGENGEYHTFCYAGGMFSYPVPFTLGKPRKESFPVKLEDGTEQVCSYWFADLQEARE